MTAASPVSAEDKREALDAVLHSRTFSRSEQLRAFLQFVCEAEFAGRTHELTEYRIGVEVLGRRREFSPAEDSSVRTRAWELRHKLEKYYALEAPGAAVHIALPRGTYAPEFLRMQPGPAGAAVPPQPPPFELVEPREPDLRAGVRARPAWQMLVMGGIAGLLVACAAFALFLSSEPASSSRPDPVLREAWGPFADPDANVLLCAATPLHLVVGPEGHDTYGSPIYPAPAEAYPLFRQTRPLAPGQKLSLVFTDNVLGVGTMNAVVSTANVLRSMGVSYEILPERVAPISALRRRNAIVYGAPVDSEAMTHLASNTRLTVDYEPRVREFVIRDRQTTNLLVPKKTPAGEFIDVYGLVTVMPNRESEGSRLGTIAFAGITSTGTQGAAEFFASPNSMRELRARFEREGIRGFPPAYQVVVRCTFSNKLLLKFEYYSHVVLPANVSAF